MTEETLLMELGVVVRLKSGGPRMTVTEEMADGSFECSWFNVMNAGSYYPNKEIFPPEALELAGETAGAS